MQRAFTILFILFEGFFLNVVVPGHQRGALTVAGYRPQAVTAQGCCAKDVPAKGCSDRKPSQSDKAHCAMCFFIAGLCIPPMPAEVPSLCKDSQLCRPWTPIRITGLFPRLTYLGRAPPTPTPGIFL